MLKKLLRLPFIAGRISRRHRQMPAGAGIIAGSDVPTGCADR